MSAIDGPVKSVQVSNNHHLHHRIWSTQSNRYLAASNLIAVADQCIDELDWLVAANVNLHDTTALKAAMPHCRQLAAKVRTALIDGGGCVVIDRIPVARYDAEQHRQIAGALGALIAPLMAQDQQGTYLYDVLDKGRPASGQIRRSKTNVAQPFHTDGGWLNTPPQFVGLYCIAAAASGGSSQVASLLGALSLCAEHDAQNWLARPVFWNRMSEHQLADKPFSHLPISENPGSQQRIRHYADYVRSGFQLAGQALPAALAGLLVSIDRTLASSACKPFMLEPGQFQYLNNWHVAHARSHFEATTEESSNRHLVRIWNHPCRLDQSA